MSKLAAFRRQTGRTQAADVRAPLRIREPRGLIPSDRATEMLMPFVGCQLGPADTSMDRLVVAITTEPMHLLVIAGPVVVSNSEAGSGSQISVCHSPGSPEAVAGLDTLNGREVTDVVVSPSGSLRVGVRNGYLSVDSDPSYEAWEIRGMDGGLLACLPGGAISLWTPTAGAEDPTSQAAAAS